MFAINLQYFQDLDTEVLFWRNNYLKKEKKRLFTDLVAGISENLRIYSQVRQKSLKIQCASTLLVDKLFG